MSLFHVACHNCINPSECLPHQTCARNSFLPVEINMNQPQPWVPPPVMPVTPTMGWLCLKCSESNAPFMPTCSHCANKQGAKA